MSRKNISRLSGPAKQPRLVQILKEFQESAHPNLLMSALLFRHPLPFTYGFICKAGQGF